MSYPYNEPHAAMKKVFLTNGLLPIDATYGMRCAYERLVNPSQCPHGLMIH